jgi:uncharacterized protein YkwD
MKFTLFNTIAALFLVLGLFSYAAPSAYADTLTLPQQFSYAGLTFVEPLSYSKQLPTEKETFTFTHTKTIQITHQETNQVIGEIVLQPTITAMTLPVLPTQLPPAVFKNDEDQTADPTPTNKTPTPTGKTLVQASLVKTAEAATIAPTAAPTATPAPVAPSSNAGGLDAEKLFNMSNAYRQAQGLPAFQKDERACSLAASRAPEIAGEVAGGYMHAGLRARALPYWNSENIISMRTEESAFNWWINDKIHHDAIVGNYTYSCVACSGNSCAQEFTNFQPK